MEPARGQNLAVILDRVILYLQQRKVAMESDWLLDLPDTLE